MVRAFRFLLVRTPNTIENAIIEQVPSKALSVLSSLISLNLNYNEIDALHPHAFRGLISLLRLALYGNKIKVIDALAFVGVGGNLTRVNLGKNELTLVPSKALAELTSLTVSCIFSKPFSQVPREPVCVCRQSRDPRPPSRLR